MATEKEEPAGKEPIWGFSLQEITQTKRPADGPDNTTLDVHDNPIE